MPRLPANTSAMTALAAPTPTNQDLNQVESQVTAVDLANLLTDVEIAIGSITAAGTLGATTTNLTPQRTCLSDLGDLLTTGVGSLVDANMNEATTKLAALQVQQQLGVQALSISNSNTQLILKLFEL